MIRSALSALLTALGALLLAVPAPADPPKPPPVLVAVIDSGVDDTHDALKGRVADARDFTASPSGARGTALDHGTHVAGIVVANYPRAALVSAKVVGDDLRASQATVLSGFAWVEARGVDVVNLSMGRPFPDPLVHESLKRLTAAGVIVVVAAGNSGPFEDTLDYPAAYPEAIAVGNVDKDNAPHPSTSRGPNVFVAARGTDVLSCTFGNKLRTATGTSMAAPVVAALAAEWVERNRAVPKADRPAKFRAALKDSCVDVHEPGRDTATGWGVPDRRRLFK